MAKFLSWSQGRLGGVDDDRVSSSHAKSSLQFFQDTSDISHDVRIRETNDQKPKLWVNSPRLCRD